jgi:hypothetical protein
MDEYSITNFSAIPTVRELFRKLGFAVVDSTVRIIPPLPGPGLFRRPARLTWDTSQIASCLDGEALQVFRDHLPFRCYHGLVRAVDGDCYFLLTRSIRKRLPFAKVQYVSDTNVFYKQLDWIRLAACLQTRSVALLLDERFAAGHPIVFSYPLRVTPMLYKSPGALGPSELTPLYSEEFLLSYS